MSKDGTTRGGQRPGAGRKPKAVTEKYANGNPGGRKLTVMDFGDTTEALQGVEMPPVKDYLKATQKDGTITCAEEIFKETWSWLHERKCDHIVTSQQIESYAMSVARWIQCEEAITQFGFLAKKPTGTVTSSPYVNMAREYCHPGYQRSICFKKGLFESTAKPHCTGSQRICCHFGN